MATALAAHAIWYHVRWTRPLVPHRHHRHRQPRARSARAALIALFVAASTGGCSVALDWDVSHLPPGGDANPGDGSDAGNDTGSPPDDGNAQPDVVTSCDGADLSTDPDHCGQCGIQCPGTACRMGQCTNDCLLGRLDCDGNVVTGCEVIAATNTDHCGSCNNACRGVTAVCCNGACQRTCP